MARLESQAKMGYYSTPEETLECIKEKLIISPGAVMLDPCCGEGSALMSVADEGGTSFGIELDTERAVTASDMLDTVICGSIYEAIVRPLDSFSMLCLNPPYDWEDGERAEFRFLRHSHKWLMKGGLLVYLVPEYVLTTEKVARFIGRNYADIRVFRFTRDDYPVFKQVVLFGVKREEQIEGRIPMPPYAHIEDTDGIIYKVPPSNIPQVFELEGIRPEDIEGYRPAAVKSLLETVGGVKRDDNILSPLFPLRKGHLVSLLMSGVLNGQLKDGAKKLVFKCYTERHKSTRTVEDNGETKEITNDSYVSGIRVIEKGQWYDVT
jgi:Uncharacterised methyltransferase family (DUF6094)